MPLGASFSARRCRSYILASLCLATPLCLAQSAVDGAISGRIADQRGDSIAGAQVVVGSAAMAVSRALPAAGDGTYIAGRLAPGTYTVTVSAPGFQSSIQAATVELGAITTLDLRLNLEQVVTLISVDAAPVTFTNSASASPAPAAPAANSLISPEQLESLPLDGRRWQTFALLLPGVGSGSDSDSEAAVSFRGIATTQNSSQIDGASDMQSFGSVPRGTGGGAGRESEEDDDTGGFSGSGGDGARAMSGRHAGAAYTFAQGAVQEFRVNSGVYSALDGRAAGGVVTTISKSGTSSIKGSVFYLARDSAWGATNPFSVVTHYTDGVITSGLVKPRDLRQQFGGSLGGPIALHRNKQPAAPFKPDRLFYFLAFDGQRRSDPAISAPGYAGFYALTATQQALLGNRGVTAKATTAALNYLDSLTGEIPRRSDQDIVFGKLDWQASPKNRISLQENHVRWDSPGGARSEPVIERGTASIGNAYGKVDAGIARLVSLWTSHLSNEVRLAYSRDFEYETAQPPLPQEPAIGPGGLAPEISIGPNGFTFGTPASLGRKAYPDEHRLQAAEMVEWIHGRHLLQVGADFSQIHDRIDALTNQEGTFRYDSGITDGKAGGLVDWITDYTFSATAYPNGGCPSIHAKIHLFCFRTFSQSFGQQTVSFPTREWAGFIQDEWRVTPKFHISAGVRYEYQRNPAPQDPNPALDALFTGKGSTSIFPEDRNNIGPRLGLAWQPFGAGKGTVHVGYGLYFGRLPGATLHSALIDTALPGSATHVRITPSTITTCPQVANQGFGYGCTYLTTPPAAVVETSSATLFDSRFRLPAVQQGTFGIEREIGAGIVASASYLLNLDRQLPNSVDINIAPATGMELFQLQGGPVLGSGPIGVKDGETFLIPYYTARVSPLYGPVTDIVSNANATYNALTLEATRRTRGALEFRAAWIWSKAIDYGQNTGAVPRTNSQFDPFTLGYDKGLSTLNFPHKITASAIWEPRLVTPHRAVRLVANGWEVSPLAVVASGRPYSYEIFGGTRLLGGHTSINGSGGAVYLPTVGRNTLRLPEQVQIDLRLARSIRLTERLRLRAAAEVFNLPNHVNYTSTTTRAYLPGVESGGITPLIFQDAAAVATEGFNVQPFGAYTAASTNYAREREAQFGLHIEF